MVASTEMMVFSVAPEPVFLKKKLPLRLSREPRLRLPLTWIWIRFASSSAPSSRSNWAITAADNT